MSGTFIFAIINLVAGLLIFGGLRATRLKPIEEPPDDASYADRREYEDKVRERENSDVYFFRRCIAVVAAVAVAMGLLLTLFASITTVSTKKVGVVTSFGRPTGTVLPNGLHFKLPWEKTTEFDAAIQTDSYGDATGGNTETPPIQVKIVNQATGNVHVSVRWQISTESADELFQDYKTFDNVRASLVTRELRAALNDVFADYDALSTVVTLNPDGTEQTAGAPTYEELSREATTVLAARVDGQVEILSVAVSFVAFDDATQSRINGLQEEVGNTRVAEQRQATAEAEAEANRALAASVSNDPNVLVAECMRTLRTLVEKGQTLPAGFSCWPAGGAPFAVTN